MGASFRNKGEITELAGCDLLTISPSLLGELQSCDQPIARKLDATTCAEMEINRLTFDEKSFRYAFNHDAMATEKTADGIRKFAADIEKLEALMVRKLDG